MEEQVYHERHCQSTISASAFHPVSSSPVGPSSMNDTDIGMSTSLESSITRLQTDDEDDDNAMVRRVHSAVAAFYQRHFEIDASHGWPHVVRVYQHTVCALQQVGGPSVSTVLQRQVLLASLLHDVDDSKYFACNNDYENARALLKEAMVPETYVTPILEMISYVSCSKNGNQVPFTVIKDSAEDDWVRLYPRWADRIEAVGARGVVRCYQYNRERGLPLCSDASPRAVTEEQVWALATPERFERYQSSSGGSSTDMISHYYDKLLHVACPPRSIVRNAYLEQTLQESAAELIQVCLRYGRTGQVDEAYIQSLHEE